MIDIARLKNEKNICIFIRHGEKNNLNFCLTDKGKNEIVKFGNSLCLLNNKIKIYSSPENRCIETASIISNIVNTNNDFYISDVLGKPGIQVKNEAEYTKLTDIMRCRDIYKEWKIGRHDNAMKSPETIKTEIVDFLKKTSIKDGITLYISQSGTVACTAYSLGLADYKADDEEWVGYLEGYILSV